MSIPAWTGLENLRHAGRDKESGTMKRSGKILPSRWLVFAVFAVICGMCRETVIGNLFLPVAGSVSNLHDAEHLDASGKR